MTVLEALQNRHSVRKYTGEAIPQADLEAVINSGLLSASSRGLRPWELIVVRDKHTLKKLSDCRPAAKMLEGADAAIVVVGDEEKSDVWVEDCSIVMANMHLAADSLGLGSCWIQGRLRDRDESQSAEDYVRRCLGVPSNMRLEAILSLGVPQSHPPKTDLSALPTEKVHYDRF